MNVATRLRALAAAGNNDVGVREPTRESDGYHLARAMDWLCRSQDATDCGGSAATYNLVLGWEDAYPETTGYIVPTMFAYGSATDSPGIVDRAVRMADWLRSIQRSDGSFPGGTGEDGAPSVFNTGQIVFGLVEAYRRTGDDRYRRAATDACDWLVAVQREAGYWDEHDYRGEVHAYSTRVGWALLEAASVAPNRADVYRERARRNLDWAVSRQRPNGWFADTAFESGGTPYLHTIAYTIRGLLEGGIELDDARFVDAARTAADTLRTVQETDGVLRGAYDDDWSPSWYYCLTGNAQMALVWLRLLDRTGDAAYLDAARRSVDFLKRRQVCHGPAVIRGAIPGSYPIVGSYMYLRFPNWAVKFFADVLLSIQGRVAGGSPPSEHEAVVE